MWNEVELRALDQAECWAGGMAPGEALARSVAGSTASHAEYVDGDLVCFWGYSVRGLVAGGWADMWLLSVPGMEEHRVGFGRRSRRMVAELLVEYGTVRCEVWEGHAPALRWLQWLGFKIMGRQGRFIQMEKRRRWDS